MTSKKFTKLKMKNRLISVTTICLSDFLIPYAISEEKHTNKHICLYLLDI
jgi:hypothetical protein